MRPLRVFLCHASQDKPAVRELYNALKSQEWIDPWLDKVKILPGQDWEMAIEKAVDDSDVVIVCLSNQSVSKEGYVQKEIRYAYEIALEKPEGTIFLIPLRLDNCIVPRKLKLVHWVEYFGMEKDEAHANLLEALKLRHEQKLKAEELEREKEKQTKQELDELTRNLIAEKAAREKLEADLKAEREVRMKWENEKEKQFKQEMDELAYKLTIERSAREKAELNAKAEHEAGLRLRREQESKEKTETMMEDSVVKPAPSFSYHKAGGLAEEKSIPKSVKNKKILSSIWKIGLTLIGLILCVWGGVTVAPHIPFPFGINSPLSIESLSATNTPPPNPTIGSEWTQSVDGMVMVYVPAGKFTMGSDNNLDNEKPAHEVTLDSFWIDQTEVTNKMYAKCVDAGACAKPSSTESSTFYIYYGNSEFYDYPVIYINWVRAKTYCEWAGRRLPTEAEWEKAASWDNSTKTKRLYPWGDSVDCSYANYRGIYNNCIGDATKVGMYLLGASPYGAYDMAGNVSEWVSSLNYQYPYSIYDGRENLIDKNNPRVVRGGSWYDDASNVRASYRSGVDPSKSYNSVGFRCTHSP
jgi:formylglycine-generating enzyme required for sulfatase activity